MGLICLWFGFPVHLCVGGFGFSVVVVETWAVVEIACAFVWIFFWEVVVMVEGYWWVWIFGYGFRFLVHYSFGFFVWLLVVLMVVESGFAIGSDDETRFGCGFHVLCVESHRSGKKTVEKD